MFEGVKIRFRVPEKQDKPPTPKQPRQGEKQGGEKQNGEKRGKGEDGKKREKTKSQDLATFISDIRAFVDEMRDLKARKWKRIHVDVPTIESTVQVPTWINAQEQADDGWNEDDIEALANTLSTKHPRFDCHYPNCNKEFVDRTRFRKHLFTHLKTPKMVISGPIDPVVSKKRKTKTFVQSHQ